MSSLISIIDANQMYHSSHANFKVIVTNHNDESVVLSGQEANTYLLSNIFSGFINSTTLTQNSGILPPGVRVVGQNYVIFERPPSYQNIFYNTDKVHSEMSEENTHLFRIPVPWQVYVATFDSNYYLSSVSMFFSPTSLTSKEQPLYLPPLPNFYTNASLCRPMFSSMNDIERYPKNLTGVIAAAYDWIWNNGTNNDLNEAVVHVNLQIVSRDITLKDQTIFKGMSQQIYNAGFSNPFVVYYSSSHVLEIFRSWEKITLEEVVNLKWPVSSSDLHFPSSYYSSSSPDITDHPSYYNWLADWAADYYDGESSEDIEYMIENGEYDGDAYYEYVIHNHISPSPIEFKPFTCGEIIDQFSSMNSHYASIKGKFNTFILNAFNIKNKVKEA